MERAIKRRGRGGEGTNNTGGQAGADRSVRVLGDLLVGLLGGTRGEVRDTVSCDPSGGSVSKFGDRSPLRRRAGSGPPPRDTASTRRPPPSRSPMPSPPRRTIPGCHAASVSGRFHRSEREAREGRGAHLRERQPVPDAPCDPLMGRARRVEAVAALASPSVSYPSRVSGGDV